MIMASVEADIVSVGGERSESNPTFTVNGRIYHSMVALRPLSGRILQFVFFYIHDADRDVSNR